MTFSIPAVETQKEENRQLNYEERSCERTVITSKPLVAKIEVTTRCNLRCVMCVVRSRRNVPRDLDYAIFQRLEEIFPNLLSAYLYGVGEVMMYPRFMEMADALLAHNVNVGLITNGLLLTPDCAHALVAKRFYKFSISVDAACKETYESIRCGGSFEQLMRNIALINHYKARYNCVRPHLIFNVVVMKRNIQELSAIVDLASDCGVEEIVVNDLIVFFPEMKEQALSYDDPGLQEAFHAAQARAHAKNIRIAFPGPYQYQLIHTERKHDLMMTERAPINQCTEPWSSFWLTVDGIVTPCCYWMKPMGDLRTHTFAEIWNNETYQQLRASVNTIQRHPHCRTCAISGMARKS